MIEFRDVSFQYSKKRLVIENLNLSIPTDEVHGLLGHNGAGKTTLFRLILGIINPISGFVRIDNELPQRYKVHMSYMPETNGIYEKLTVAQNIEFRARAAKMKQGDIIGRTNELLTALFLEERKNDLAGTLSNGLKKRLGLACAVVYHPKLLLLDEPTNGIDPESMEVLLLILQQIKKTGTGLLVSSHNLDFVEELADSVSIIENGQLVFSNNLDNTYESVKNLYFSELKKYREGSYATRDLYNNA